MTEGGARETGTDQERPRRRTQGIIGFAEGLVVPGDERSLSALWPAAGSWVYQNEVSGSRNRGPPKTTLSRYGAPRSEPADSAEPVTRRRTFASAVLQPSL